MGVGQSTQMESLLTRDPLDRFNQLTDRIGGSGSAEPAFDASFGRFKVLSVNLVLKLACHGIGILITSIFPNLPFGSLTLRKVMAR